MPDPAILTRPDGTAIAYHHLAGKSPGIVFCGGFMSDMEGSKALALEEYCRANGRAFTRFDYRGHGASSGKFADGTIGLWKDDALAILDTITKGRQIIVGSSMGGWIMLLLALARPDRMHALVGIAPAPDFVVRMWDEFPAEIQAEIIREGQFARPSEYGDEPYIITRALIEDGRQHLVMDKELPVTCRVRILHGMQDPDVPWRLSLDLVEKLQSRDVEVTFVKDGDHRLSEPPDIRRLITTVEGLL
jgi:pimeloyl-ACP methyl ester carboxylesterase